MKIFSTINTKLSTINFNHDIEKFDLRANKNEKYLFYSFSDSIKTSDGKKTIKHILKIKDGIGLEKIAKRDWQFVIKKIVHSVEFKNLYENEVERKPEII